MANMQMTIGFWRKTRDDFIVLTGLEVLYNNITYEIAYRWNLLVIQWTGLLAMSGIREGGFYPITGFGHYSWRLFCNINGMGCM